LAVRFGQGKSMPYAGLAGLGSSFSNTAFIGFPILVQFLGMPAIVALALAMIVDNLLVLPLALPLMESGNDQGGRWGRALGQSPVRRARNPLIIAIGAGFAFALSGIRLPSPAARTLALLAMASTGMALCVVGGSLAGVRVRGMLRGLMEIAAAKLVLHPLAVAGFLWLLPTIDPALRVAAVILACMPTLSILPILAQKHDLEGFCAAALLVTTVVSFVTINAALWILRRLGAA
jgi:predicted permease